MITETLHNYFEFIPTFILREGDPIPSQAILASWCDIPSPVKISAKSTEPDGPSGPPVTIDPSGLHRGSVLLDVPIPPGISPGDKFKISINVSGFTAPSNLLDINVVCVRPHDDWTLFLGAGYHVDPVWWNTQRDYTEVASRQGEGVNSFIELNRQYLDILASDPDFACTLETVPALLPTWLFNPEFRPLIKHFISEGRLELIGSFTEPQSTLVGCELMCRNIAYGVGFAQYLSGVRPKGLAQWDVFGHDPVWPALGASAGLSWTTFCRGLYHGDHLNPEENLFPSEFRWISPDGSEHLTHYMSRHYTSGWEFPWTSMAEAEIPVIERFEQLRRTASTRNVLLTCYGDFAEPFEGIMDFVRQWNLKNTSPKIRFGTQDDYLSAVMESASKSGTWLLPISRDLNPAFSGCNMSFAETKIAQRIGECTLRDAEIWATFASLSGAEYPLAALDRAWQILCYTSHHDAVTGSESDQVYLDLCALWREASDIGTRISSRAKSMLASLTSPPDSRDGTVISVFNSLGWDHSSPVFLSDENIPESKPTSVIDETGQSFPLEEVNGGWQFIAKNVPALGWKNFRMNKISGLVTIASPQDPHTIENEYFKLRVDPEYGGGILSLTDAESGFEYIREKSAANDIVVYPEYPGMNMAPWLVQPTGDSYKTSANPAEVSRKIGRGVQSLNISVDVLGCRVVRNITLWYGLPYIHCRTSIQRYADRDHMWRIEFPVALNGVRPVAQTSGGVIGRSFGRLGDFQEIRYLGNWPVDLWAGLECPLAFSIDTGAKEKYQRTVAVGEIIIPDSPVSELLDHIDRLVKILALSGVTTVVTKSSGRRSGDWLKDSSRPDFRIAVGPKNNFYDETSKRSGLSFPSRSTAWVDLPLDEPGLDLPVLLFPPDHSDIRRILDSWTDSVACPPAIISVDGPSIISDNAKSSGKYGKFTHGFDLLVRGTPDMLCLEDGTISLGLFRSASAPPSGGWVDANPVRMPDGSYFQHEHWTHNFEYRLMPHSDDWRTVDTYRRAIEFNHPLESVAGSHHGPLPPSGNFIELKSQYFFIQSLRPAETPEYSFEHPDKPLDPSSGLLFSAREIDGKNSLVQFGENIRDLTRVNLLGENIGGEKDLAVLSPWQLATFSFKPPTSSIIIPGHPSLENSLGQNLLWPARYWRSSLGPSGWNGQPVFHKFLERSAEIVPGDTKSVTLVIVNNLNRKIHGITLEFRSSDRIHVHYPGAMIFDLGPGEIRSETVNLECIDPESDNGSFIIAILTVNEIRTVAALPINRSPDLPAPVWIQPPEALIVAENESVFSVDIQNFIAQEIEGFLEIILPFEAWNLISPENIRIPVTLPKYEAVALTLDIAIKNRKHADPGSYYCVLKWHSCEEQEYSVSFPIIVPDSSGTFFQPEQGRTILFDRPGLSANFNIFTRHDNPVGIRIEDGGDSTELETIHDRAEIDGGFISRFEVTIPKEKYSDPHDLPMIVNLREGNSSAEFLTTLKIPRGPRLNAALVLKHLTVDDPLDKWAQTLISNIPDLTFIEQTGILTHRKSAIPIWLGYDFHNLYLAVDVPWKIAPNPYEKRGILKADSLHLAFFPNRLAELGYALTTREGPYSWTFYEIMDAPRPKSPPVSIRISDNWTTYMTAIPWGMIFLNEQPAVLPFNIMVHTSDQDGNPAGAWCLTDAVLSRPVKDATDFGLIIMESEEQPGKLTLLP